MAFWDRFKKPPTDRPPPEGGKLKHGKKHGRWVEYQARDTRWDDAARKSVELETFGWHELTYLHGVKQGPFVWRWSNGAAQRTGTYVDDAIEGPLVIQDRDGHVVGRGTFRKGELHGPWVQHHSNGNLDYESDYIDGKRHGAWVWAHENGQVTERGAHDNNERTGEWSIWTKEGVLVEQGPYVAGKRHGHWRLRRADGSVCGEGMYVAGAMSGMWRAITREGVVGAPHACTTEAELEAWGKLEVCAALMASYDGSDAWAERARSSIDELAQPWQVTTRTELGQTFASAPITAVWQLRVAAGVPLHVAFRDEVWSDIKSALDAIPAAQRAEAVALARGCKGMASREWLTAIVDDEADDPRAELVTQVEPGRSFTTERAARFQRRLPHLEVMRMRECAFPDGFAALFATGYPALELLYVLDCELEEGGADELCQLLARATWVGNLQALALLRNTDVPSDAAVAALLANPHLRELEELVLTASVGPATARALREGAGRHLASVELRESDLAPEALAALVALPALEDLVLRDCTLPALTSRQAMALTSPALRRVTLAGTLGVDRYGEESRTPYAVARRLALVPALAKLELLDLSGNELDGLAARVLARSPHVRSVRTLDWTGNEDDPDEIAELTAVMPPGTLVTDTPAPAGNIVTLRLG